MLGLGEGVFTSLEERGPKVVPSGYAREGGEQVTERVKEIKHIWRGERQDIQEREKKKTFQGLRSTRFSQKLAHGQVFLLMAELS